MDKFRLDKQEMFAKLDEVCTLSEDIKLIINYGYERGYNFANKINRKNNIIRYIFVCIGFIIGNLLNKLIP